MKKARFITHSAVIAAVYAVLTIAVAPLSYGSLQIRISEALTFMPALTPAAIPGLFVGCLISNLFSPTFNYYDLVLGSLTTLAAAIASYKLRKRPWLVPLPPIVLNAIVVGWYLTFLYSEYIFPINMLLVGGGEIIACYIIPVYFIINYEKLSKKVNTFFQY